MLSTTYQYTPDATTRSATATVNAAIKRLTAAYDRMSTYESGEAGPAMRGAFSALNWRDHAQGGDVDALAAASALCNAACEIEARKGWPRLIDCPWPGWEQEVRALYRAAERLWPGILAPDQREAARLKG